ncbi:MAG: thermonuclease family protein [Nitrosopumilus sp.]|nr:thermonuclease family protein [Nitrosopumilus sp.]
MPCLGNGLCILARVERIVDGDTIYVEGYKIRLSLTNTPEKNEAGFLDSTEFTKRLCPVGSVITIDQDDKQRYDKYGRLLGKVYCNGKNLNSELLYNGHASILPQYCSSSEFSDDLWAQKYGCGISQKSEPVQNEQTTDDCDPSYPDVCIPPYPPDLDCKDVPYKKFKVIPPDPHRFDGDKDGIGCES